MPTPPTPKTRTLFRVGQLRVVEDSWRSPEGHRLRSVRVESPSFAVVVAVTRDGRMVLVRNLHRNPGLGLLELPGGRIERGETPSAAARRELAEETGYRAGRLKSIGQYYPHPHWSRKKGHLFLAQELRSGSPDLDPGECLEVRLLPVTTVYERLARGHFRDGSTILGLNAAAPHLWGRLLARSQEKGPRSRATHLLWGGGP